MISRFTILFSTIFLCACTTHKIDKPLEEKFNATSDATEMWHPVESSESLDEYAIINDKAYSIQDDKILVSKSDLENELSRDTQIYNPSPIAGLELKEGELQTLMADKDAFFIFLNNPNLSGHGDVSFPVLQGSLQENIKNFARRLKIDSVLYESDFDYFVPEDQIIVASDAEEILFTMLKGFPLEAHIIESMGKSTLRVVNTDEKANYISFVAKEGSLKKAAAELSEQAGWDFEWEFKYDFLINETTILRAKTYEELMGKLLTLNNYPIKANKDESEQGHD